MLSCKQVVEIISTKPSLSLMKRIELRAHLFMCKHCSTYLAQLNTMTDKLKSVFKEKTETTPERVQDLENRIIKKLKNQRD